jgi:predicted RNase H-like nuclease
MIPEIRGHKILLGARGRSPADREAIFQILMKIACLASEWPEAIREIDINPLVVMEEGKGARAVDALVLLR